MDVTQSSDNSKILSLVASTKTLSYAEEISSGVNSVFGLSQITCKYTHCADSPTLVVEEPAPEPPPPPPNASDFIILLIY